MKVTERILGEENVKPSTFIGERRNFNLKKDESQFDFSSLDSKLATEHSKKPNVVLNKCYSYPDDSTWTQALYWVAYVNEGLQYI